MRIAIDLSFITPHDHSREGITRYNQFLFDAFLEYDRCNVIELWGYKSSRNDIVNCYGFLKEKYPNQIFFYCNNNKYKPREYSKFKLHKLQFKLLVYNVLLKFFNHKTFLNKVGKYTKKISNLIDNPLQKFIEANSKAQILFSDWIRLEMGHYFKCPKVLMIHDIFPIALRDLFAQSRDNIDKGNLTMLRNINQYLKEGAYIVTSSKYILNEQIFKFIPDANKRNTRVIYYPPIFQNFTNDDILSKEDFYKKYNIVGDYMPYPSQNRPNKNLILLLKALRRLKENNVNIKLVTTGKISDVSSNKEYVEKYGLEDMIIEIGSIDNNDLYALYKYAKLIAVPTLIEGPGMSQQCLEALKVGNIPVVHTKSLGIEDSLNQVGLDFESADLNWIDIEDDEGLAYFIKDILKNSQRHIAKQKCILEAYNQRSWKKVVEEYMDVFNELILQIRKN